MDVATSKDLHVLLAHGNTGLRRSYHDELTDRGFLVTTANDGLACLSLLRGITPNVLILERELPWGGGDGVLARLQEDCGLQRIPIVILLAESQRTKPVLAPAANLQFCDHLLSPQQLTRKIHQLLAAVGTTEDKMVYAS